MLFAVEATETNDHPQVAEGAGSLEFLEGGILGLGRLVAIGDDVDANELSVFCEHEQHCISRRSASSSTERVRFVGIDIIPNGNKPTKSKYAAFKKLQWPGTFGDLW